MKTVFKVFVVLITVFMVSFSVALADTVTFVYPFVILDSSGAAASSPGSEVYRAFYDISGNLIGTPPTTVAAFSQSDSGISWDSTIYNSGGVSSARFYMRLAFPSFTSGSCKISFYNTVVSKGGSSLSQYFNGLEILLFPGTSTAVQIANNQVTPLKSFDYMTMSVSTEELRYNFNYEVTASEKDILYQDSPGYYWLCLDYRAFSAMNIWGHFTANMTVSYDGSGQFNMDDLIGGVPGYVAPDAPVDEFNAEMDKMDSIKNDALQGKTDDEIMSDVENAMNFDFDQSLPADSGKVRDFLNSLQNVLGTDYMGAVMLSLTLGLACFIIGRRYS